MNSEPIIISIDGLVGAGKTTLINRLKTSHPEFNYIDEPVDEWTDIIDDNGHSILENFYNDKSRWSYTFQLFAINSRHKSTLKILNDYSNNPNKYRSNIFITERSIFTDRFVFAQMLYDRGFMNTLEWKLYCKNFDNIKNDYNIAGFIHLNTDTDLAFARIEIRNRQGEDCVSKQYLTALKNYHLNMFAINHKQMIYVSGDTNADYSDSIIDIECFIKVITKCD